MEHPSFHYSSFWMTPKRAVSDCDSIKRRILEQAEKILDSEQLKEFASKVGIWFNLVVDEELPAGLHRVSRGRNPAMWSIFVVVPYSWIADADDALCFSYFIDAWKIGLSEGFRRIKLPAEESERLLRLIESIRNIK